jgi:hypothetical protein
MIKMTIDEWGEHIFNKNFTVLYIDYDNGITTVYDTLREVTYVVTYNGEFLILEELHDDEKV